MPNSDSEESEDSGSHFLDDDDSQSTGSGYGSKDKDDASTRSSIRLGATPEQPLDNYAYAKERQKDLNEMEQFNDETGRRPGRLASLWQNHGWRRLFAVGACLCCFIIGALVIILILALKEDDTESNTTTPAAPNVPAPVTTAPPTASPVLTSPTTPNNPPPPTTTTTPTTLQPSVTPEPSVTVVQNQAVDFAEASLQNPMVAYVPIVLPPQILDGRSLASANVVRVKVALPTKTSIIQGDEVLHLDPQTYSVDLTDLEGDQIPTLGSACPPANGERHMYSYYEVPTSINVDIPTTVTSATVTCLEFKAVAISYHTPLSLDDGVGNENTNMTIPDDFVTTVEIHDGHANTTFFGNAAGIAVLVGQSYNDEFFIMEENPNFIPDTNATNRMLEETGPGTGKLLQVGDPCPAIRADDPEEDSDKKMLRLDLLSDDTFPHVAYLVLDGTHRKGRKAVHVYVCDPDSNTIAAKTKFAYDSGVTPAPTESPTTAKPTQSPSVAVVEDTVKPTDAPTSAPSQPTPGATDPPETPQTTDSPTSAPTTASAITYGLQPDCGVNDPNKFNICLDIKSKSGKIEPWFEDVVRAKEMWEQIITADPWGPWSKEYLSANSVNIITGTSLPDVDELDDIYIAVIEDYIDGGGGSFAIAGPDLIHSSLAIPTGSIFIETADIGPAMDNDIWYPLMIHEMGHVIGIGTFLSYVGLADENTYFGSKATEFWESTGCSGPVPFKSWHWDEDCTDLEILSPFFKYGKPWYISGLTMGALEDLGFEVDRSLEMEYGMDQLGSKCSKYCPEKGTRRRLGTPSESLSASGVAAAEKVGRDHLLTKGAHRDSVSVLYQEGDKVFSRVVRRETHCQKGSC